MLCSCGSWMEWFEAPPDSEFGSTYYCWDCGNFEWADFGTYIEFTDDEESETE